MLSRINTLHQAARKGSLLAGEGPTPENVPLLQFPLLWFTTPYKVVQKSTKSLMGTQYDKHQQDSSSCFGTTAIFIQVASWDLAGIHMPNEALRAKSSHDEWPGRRGLKFTLAEGPEKAELTLHSFDTEKVIGYNGSHVNTRMQHTLSALLHPLLWVPS